VRDNQTIKEKVKQRVYNLLVSRYNVNEEMAYQMVNDSVLSHMLEFDLTFVTHYNDDEWAEDILEQYNMAV
jgi:uncharacterized protein (UPF0297 family)